jgi:hypothetical protein
MSITIGTVGWVAALFVFVMLPQKNLPSFLSSLILGVFFVCLDIMLMNQSLFLAAGRRGRPLLRSQDSAMAMNGLARWISVIFLLTLHATSCLFSAIVIVGLTVPAYNLAYSLGLLAILLYLAFSAACLTWIVRSDRRVHVWTGPVLPLLLLKDMATWAILLIWPWRSNKGRETLANFKNISILLAQEIKLRWRRILTSIGIALTSIIAMGAILFIEILNSSEVLSTAASAVVICAACLVLPLFLFIWGLGLTHAAKRVNSAEEAMRLLAATRSSLAFGLVLARLDRRGTSRDGATQATYEALLGEIEDSQRRAEHETGLTLRAACPMLAKYDQEFRRVIDYLPLISSLVQLRVRDLKDSCVDALARLAEHD